LKPELMILIPARDEENNIAAVIQGVKNNVQSEIIVIDDASSDRTACIARSEGARVLPLALHLGAWGAIRTGIRYACHRQYDIAITIDADGQHQPESIRDIIEPIVSDQADVVIGSCIERGSAARKISWLFFRKFTGLNVQDLTSGFRAYNAAAISALISSDTALLDYQDIGVLLALTKAGLRIVEVPVRMCPRASGHSRVFSSWWDVFRYLMLTGILCLSKVNRRAIPDADL